MAKPKKPKNTTSGLVGYYNAHQHSGAYGSPQYAANYDPTQGFGTPQKPGSPPIDWQQQAAEAAAGRSVQFADAQATYDRGRINRDFGYGANGAVDPNNPYSRASLLELNHAQSQRGITNSAGLQLYAGSTQNAKNAETFNYLSNSNQLKNQYSDALNQTYSNQLGTYANAGGAVSQEKIAALLRALGQA